MINRTFKINDTQEGFHKDIVNVKNTLRKNEYPENLIDKHINNYLEKHFQNQNEKTVSENTRYFKLPYFGNISEQTDAKIKQIIEKYCNKYLCF